MNQLNYSLSSGMDFDNTNMNERTKKMNIKNENLYNEKKSINPKILNREFLRIYELYLFKTKEISISNFLNFEVLKFFGIILLYFGILLITFLVFPSAIFDMLI